MVTTSKAARIFTDTSCRRILRPILAFCLEEHGHLSLLCRNVRHLLYTDPQLRDHLFDMMYGIPPTSPSLDGPLPSRPTDPRTPHDTESYLREQALQTFSPSLVRCVHAKGPIAAVRDGYMVSFSSKQGAPDKRPTGWTVWALPLWHEARRTGVTSRDKSKSVRSDPIDVRDIPMAPRPSGAVKEQAMWMWEFDLGKEVVAMAIQPEDNLLAVAVAPVIVSYAAGHDKRHSETFRVGRRHRIYFFRLRPPGLGMAYMTEWGRPVKHAGAPRPFVDFIEPVSDPNELVQYTLKIGPDGLVGLLVKPDSRSMITSGPLIIWNWLLGSCAGVVSAIPEVGRVLDYDFMTDNHIIILEVVPIPRGDVWRRVNLPLIPHRCRLTVVQLCAAIPLNADVVYHSSKQPPSETFQHFLAHNCWTLDDCDDDNVLFVASFELPPLLDKSMLNSITPASAVFGSVDIYPPLSEDFPKSQISFTVGCKSTAQGVLVAPNQMLRGAIPAEAVVGLIPPSLKQWSINTALKRWQKLFHEHTISSFVLDDELRRLLERVATIKVHEHVADPFGIDDSFHISFRRDFRLGRGATLFRNIIKTADEAHVIRLAGSSKTPRPDSLYEALGGALGVAAHGKLFAKLLPPLATSRTALQVTDFRSWYLWADIEVLSSEASANVYGCRVVYADPWPPVDKLNPPTGRPGPKSPDGNFTLVMRNYSLELLQFPRKHVMPTARFYWPTEHPHSITLQPIPQPRPARYVQCPFPPKLVHTPWLGETVSGSSELLHREAESPTFKDKLVNDMPYSEGRVGVACDKGGVQIWFDGQTIVLAQGDRATLVCF